MIYYEKKIAFIIKKDKNMIQHTQTTIVWFRKDFRLADNLALQQATEHGQIIPVFIFDHNIQANIGQSTKWWLHQSLIALNKDLHNSLNIYQGKPEEILHTIAVKFNSKNIYFNTIFEPEQLEQDRNIIEYLQKHSITCTTFQSQLLWLPATTVKSDKTPYKVFTPFYRNGCLQSIPPRTPITAPKNIDALFDHENTTTLQDLGLLSTATEHLDQFWHVSEHDASQQLHTFIENKLAAYEQHRDIPSLQATSQLSPYLHFGQISAHQIWHAVGQSQAPAAQIDCFLKQLGWREFSYNLLYHFPTLPDQNFQQKFDNFPWQTNTQLLQAWQQGQTGYPIVDAGMRELAQTGYMHNRVRMIVASFLVKNLLLHWHHGRDWFWQHLVDADLANNSASWQWVAGSGVDAAPYFRIFNPVLQGEKFDKHGDYTRQYVPELTKMPDTYVHKPWLAPAHILKTSNIVLGKNYPLPIVDLDTSRKQALAAYHNL